MGGAFFTPYRTDAISACQYAALYHRQILIYYSYALFAADCRSNGLARKRPDQARPEQADFNAGFAQFNHGIFGLGGKTAHHKKNIVGILALKAFKDAGGICRIVG